MFCTIKGNQEDWKKFRDGADQGDDDIILAWWLGAALLLILAILFAIWLYLKSKKGQAGGECFGGKCKLLTYKCFFSY